MNFSNLNPAERMKASGLIGLIVVILFFVVHTMMGVVAPKKATAPEAGQPAPTNATANLAPTAAASPTSGTAASATDPSAAFPTEKLASARRGTGDPLSLAIHDPFIPLDGDAKQGADTNDEIKRTPKFARRGAPGGPRNSSVRFPEFDGKAPATFAAGLPTLGPESPAPNGAAVAPAPPADPEIRVVGVVHGDPSVATLQVAGRTVIARPGDALAKGWRLLSVNSEGIQIRHQTEIMPVRVGGSINESRRDEAKR